MRLVLIAAALVTFGAQPSAAATLSAVAAASIRLASVTAVPVDPMGVGGVVVTGPDIIDAGVESGESVGTVSDEASAVWTIANPAGEEAVTLSVRVLFDLYAGAFPLAEPWEPQPLVTARYDLSQTAPDFDVLGRVQVFTGADGFSPSRSYILEPGDSLRFEGEVSARIEIPPIPLPPTLTLAVVPLFAVAALRHRGRRR